MIECEIGRNRDIGWKEEHTQWEFSAKFLLFDDHEMIPKCISHIRSIVGEFLT